MNEKRLGLWRATFERPFLARPKRCGDCGSKHLDYDLLPVDEEYDSKLAADHGVPDDEYDVRFVYVRVYADCSDCHYWAQSYGPRYYYNAETKNYDLPKPLSFAQCQKNDFLFEIDSAKAAGQLELPL